MDEYHQGQSDLLREIFTETRKADDKFDAIVTVLEKKAEELWGYELEN